MGDAFAKTAGVMAVESLAEAFLQPGLLGVRSDHPTPGDGLEKSLGQADLPSEDKGGKDGGESFQGMGKLTGRVDFAKFRVGPDLGGGALGFGLQDGGDEKVQAENGDEGSGHAQGNGSDPVAGGDEPEANPQEMDQGGTEDKTGGVGGGMGEAGHLGSVGMAVKKSEDRHARHGQQDRDLAIRQNRQPQDQHGGGNAGLHREQGNVVHAENPADEHKEDEGGGNCPNGPAPHLHAEEPHTEHGKEVVKAKNGMGEPAGETVPVEAYVGPGAGRQEKNS